MNSIRLNRKQRDAIGVAPGDLVAFVDGFGHARKAKVKRALRHHMATGLHTDTHAPVEVHDGPTPRPSKAKVAIVEPHRIASAPPPIADDDGINMSEASHEMLVDRKRLFGAQSLATYGDRFEYTFTESEPPPIKSVRSKAAFERLRGRSDVADVTRVYVDEDASWRVAGRIVHDDPARAEVEQSLHAAGIIEDPDIDGGLLG